MGELVNLLNTAGGAFVAFAAHMLIQSSVLIALLAILDLVLRKRVKAVVRYWIWLLVLAKLVLPPSFSSPTGVAYWVGGKLPSLPASVEPVAREPLASAPPAGRMVVSSVPSAPESGSLMGHASEEPTLARAEGTPSAAPITQRDVSITWQTLALLGWAVVVVVMAVLLIQRALFVHGLVAQSHEPPEEIVELFRQCARRMEVRMGLAVKLSPLSASPSVCGLRRPVILIPEEMLTQLRVHELKSVLFHELAHIKRGDLWLNLVQALLQIVYFYHPLLWAANVRIRRVREQAVDETVLAAMGEEAEDYPRTLLSVSRLAFGQPTLSLRLLGVVESKKALTDRIRHIVSRPFPKSAKLGLAGLIMVLAVGATLLPMARAKSSTPPAGERVAPAVSAAGVAPTPRELLDHYRKAVTGWDQSVAMRVECDHSMNDRGRDIRHWKYDLRQRRDGDRYESFGRCQFEGKLDGHPYAFNEEFRHLVLDDYYLYYSRRDSGRESEAFLGTDVGERRLDLEMQSENGSFLQGRTGGIGSATHHAQAMCDSNEVHYIGQETLGGTLCHVVEAKTRYGTFTVWLAPEKGYNALKSLWRKSGRDILRENIRIENQGIAEWTETVDAVDVQKIDGVFLPVAGRLTGRTKWAGGEESEDHITVQRREIVLHPDFQALGAFQMVLPEGTEARLAGNAQRTFRWSQGKFTPDINKYLTRSLLGKPLPGLAAIRMDWDLAEATGRMLVICLLDVQQRPSRSIALQIAKQADSLQQKDAAILAIQAAKMDDTAFKTWVKESQVPFPLGMIQGEEEEARAAWGVQALPWLILTDRDHIVRAEGFNLSDLQNKMETVARLPRTSAESQQSKLAPLPRAGDVSVTPSSASDGERISGTVVDPNGNAIVEAHVTLEDKDLLQLPQPQKDDARTSPVMREASTQTDSQGHFAFAQLNPGITDLSAAAAGHRTEFLYGVSTGGADLRIVLAEPRPYRVSGVVVDGRDKPVPDVRVTFAEDTMSGPGRGKDGSPVTVRTDATGVFRFDRLLPPADGQSMRRLLYARKQGYGIWGTELDTTGGQTSIRIKLTPEEKVSGVVKNETGAPIPDASVFLYSVRGRIGSFWFAPSRQQLAPQATTQADGSFTLGQLPTDSDLFLRVRAQGYASGELAHARTGPFGSGATLRRDGAIMTAGNGHDSNTPFAITLEHAAALRGALMYEGTGQPAPAIRVATQAQKGGAWSEAVTDANGRFEITGVSPVPCNLLVLMDDLSRHATPEWTAPAVSLDALQPGDTVDGLRLVLTKGGLVRGKVTDQAGEPLQGIDIAFYSAARPRSGAACQFVLTGADGTWAYRFPPGEVYIYIRTPISGGTWQRPSYTYNLSAGQTIDGADFVLSQAVPQRSPYRGRPGATAGATGRTVALPMGAQASAVKEWPRAEGGNGHSYMAVRMPGAVSWTDANDIAQRLGGYLATITSEAENEFVFRLADDDTYWYHGINWRGPWIGGYQSPGASEPDGGWRWVTAEPFDYQNWDAGQPNNYNGTAENYVIYGNQRRRVNTWNDVVVTFREAISFVVEYDK